ncbi:MAG TPA: response regulator, partial [Sphingomonas sp.]|uniref:response regulator n=1 Tax=Sphingomonas sp. TaxID=28214 RepID=UPI002ED8BC8D
TVDRIAEPVQARRAAKVLLVDDEDVVRFATADMLRDIGYIVVVVASASQALAAVLGGLDADVVVTDYLMPGMTGGELITELRAAGHRIPALLITGYSAAGADVPGDVPRLAKPFRQFDLAARVDEVLSAPPPRRGHLRAVE